MISDCLTPGEEISYYHGEINKNQFDLSTKILWTDGIIYFDNTPLDPCLKTLETWCGVDIEIIGKDLRHQRKGSGRFDNDYLTNVLTSISYAQEFKYEINQKRVYITFK